MSQGLSVWVLEALDGFGDTAIHGHHAIQITVCLEGDLALASGDLTLRGPIVAVAPHARHRLVASGLLGIVFVEPESPSGRALMSRLFEEQALARVDNSELLARLQPLRRAIVEALPQEKMLEIGRHAIDVLAPTAPAPTLDPRIARIVDYAAAHLDQALSLAAVSAGVHLSESRLRHLFVEQTGLAFKTYLLWLRLVRAVQLYAEGSSLTEAAHAAGFADSAHFSRVFKRTFGAPATTLTRL